MVTLRAFEPAGLVIDLSNTDLARHLLAVGATGSGKTTAVMNPVLEQLLAAYPGAPAKRVGVLVLDPKGDDSAERVLEYARRAGREEDVLQLGPRGNSYYPFFNSFTRLEQTDEFARRVLLGSCEMGRENAYWSETRAGLVSSALVLLLAGGETIEFDSAVRFIRGFVYEADSPIVNARLKFVEKLATEPGLLHTTRRRLEQALLDARNWANLDVRTKELHRSTLGNALRPLLSPAAHLYLEEGGRRFDPALVLQGRILLVSLSAVSEPQLAAMLFKALKRDFFRAILSRSALSVADRCCALVLDELQLSATPSDEEALAVLRSHGGMVIAATQSLSALEEVMGHARRESLLNNFGNYFFFGAREAALDEFAQLSLGLDKPEDGWLAESPGGVLLIDKPLMPICPAGALARLPEHHCYIKLASGWVSPRPVWLEPHFHEAKAPVAPPAKVDDLAAAVIRLRAVDQQLQEAGVPRFLVFMQQRGYKLCNSPSVVAAVWLLYKPKASRSSLLESARATFCNASGLDALPTCWLADLLRLQLWNPGLANCTNMVVREGVLWLEPVPLLPWPPGGPSLLVEIVNRHIYPSLWQELRPAHMQRLLNERPDLRQDLSAFLPENEE